MAKYSLQLTVDSDSMDEITELAQRLAGDSASSLLFGLVGRAHNCSHADSPAKTAAPEAAEPNDGASAAPAAPNYTTFGINVYESDDHAFALGKKIYANAREAEEKMTRNGNWLTSFDLDINLATGDVRATDNNGGDKRYFAVNRSGANGIAISKGYSTESAAASNNEDALAVVAIAVNDSDTVSVSNA
jgi:hypothetical protein